MRGCTFNFFLGDPHAADLLKAMKVLAKRKPVVYFDRTDGPTTLLFFNRDAEFAGLEDDDPHPFSSVMYSTAVKFGLAKADASNEEIVATLTPNVIAVCIAYVESLLRVRARPRAWARAGERGRVRASVGVRGHAGACGGMRGRVWVCVGAWVRVGARVCVRVRASVRVGVRGHACAGVCARACAGRRVPTSLGKHTRSTRPLASPVQLKYAKCEGDDGDGKSDESDGKGGKGRGEGDDDKGDPVAWQTSYPIDQIVSRVAVLLDWLKTVPVSETISSDLPLLYEYQQQHQRELKEKAKEKERKSFAAFDDSDGD